MSLRWEIPSVLESGSLEFVKGHSFVPQYCTKLPSHNKNSMFHYNRKVHLCQRQQNERRKKIIKKKDGIPIINNSTTNNFDMQTLRRKKKKRKRIKKMLTQFLVMKKTVGKKTKTKTKPTSVLSSAENHTHTHTPSLSLLIFSLFLRLFFLLYK